MWESRAGFEAGAAGLSKELLNMAPTRALIRNFRWGCGLLGGSWVVKSRIISALSGVISMTAILTTLYP